MNEKCQVCEGYVKYFIRIYGSCYAVYQDDHVCGYLHKIDEVTYIDNDYTCNNFISKKDSRTTVQSKNVS